MTKKNKSKITTQNRFFKLIKNIINLRILNIFSKIGIHSSHFIFILNIFIFILLVAIIYWIINIIIQKFSKKIKNESSSVISSNDSFFSSTNTESSLSVSSTTK